MIQRRTASYGDQQPAEDAVDLHNKVSEAGFSVSDLHNLNSDVVYK